MDPERKGSSKVFGLAGVVGIQSEYQKLKQKLDNPNRTPSPQASNKIEQENRLKTSSPTPHKKTPI